jgi:hypothetical protein
MNGLQMMMKAFGIDLKPEDFQQTMQGIHEAVQAFKRIEVRQIEMMKILKEHFEKRTLQ